MSRTYLMIKPEIVEAGKQGEIITLLSRNRFKIVRMKQFTFTTEDAKRFYSIHEGKPFFNDLISYITSGPVVGIELEADDAVVKVRELVGATNPSEARPGTIRYMYGTDIQQNAVHASDSDESAEKELAIVFGEN